MRYTLPEGACRFCGRVTKNPCRCPQSQGKEKILTVIVSRGYPKKKGSAV